MSNQKRLAANQNNYRQNGAGAREGRALLQGIVLCGLCGVAYVIALSKVPRGDLPVYYL